MTTTKQTEMKPNIDKPETREQKDKVKKTRVRLIPIWLRLLIILVLLILSLAIGAMIGYGVLGDGNAFDVFKKSTWQHIADIVVKE